MNTKITHVEGIGEVRLVRKARATQLRISVRSSGEVLVSIPWLYSFSRGEAFLSEKRAWVIKTMEKLKKRGAAKIPLQSGTLFSTRSLKYKVLPVRTDRVKVLFQPEEKSVVIGYPELASLEHPEIREKIRLNLEGVLRYEAKRYLPDRTRELAAQLGYSFKKVVIKNNRTNWGSCSGLGNINLNLHLMRLPDRLIDYILVHELVHTRIPNHGPLFKERLKSHFADAQDLDKAIKAYRPVLF
jgi:predicted metal-dependent hydrolase